LKHTATINFALRPDWASHSQKLENVQTPEAALPRGLIEWERVRPLGILAQALDIEADALFASFPSLFLFFALLVKQGQIPCTRQTNEPSRTGQEESAMIKERIDKHDGLHEGPGSDHSKTS